jgi:hypothetical protein
MILVLSSCAKLVKFHGWRYRGIKTIHQLSSRKQFLAMIDLEMAKASPRAKFRGWKMVGFEHNQRL